MKEIKKNNDILKKKHINKFSITFITLFIGIGFAVVSNTFNINGIANLTGYGWHVYFDNIQVSEKSVESNAPIIENGTTINYYVQLSKPGDFYEFTFEAINDGNDDAIVSLVDNTKLDERLNYVGTYSVTYLNGKEIKKYDLLLAKSSVTYKVRLEYLYDIEEEDLLDSDIEGILSFNLQYVKDEEQIAKDSAFTSLVKDNALDDSSIKFNQISSDTNGKGLYLLSSTKTNYYPIYYYRGNVTNNNVLFADYCWKIVRTTETGGVKLIYNGTPQKIIQETEKVTSDNYVNVENDSSYPYSYDSNTNQWKSTNHTHSRSGTITFTLKEEGDYLLSYSVSSEANYDKASFYRDGTLLGSYSGTNSGIIHLNGITTSTVIKVIYSKDGSTSSNSDNVIFNIGKGSVVQQKCTNTTGTSTQLSATSAFNTNINSLAYTGYMYGDIYEKQSNTSASNYLYGNEYTYENGTYQLLTTKKGADSSHHYTCLSSNTTCTDLYYAYYASGSTIYYITISDGKGIEDAIVDMENNKMDSDIKTTVDSWFYNSIIPYFTDKGLYYEDYLEDTIFCNDRSFRENSNWIPYGGVVSQDYFNTYYRLNGGVPTLKCSKKNDAFTIGYGTNGNGALDYPVGLLTMDEVMLAGGYTSTNTTHYLYTGQNWWTMSPYNVSDVARGYYVNTNGSFSTSNLNSVYGVRPSISLSRAVKLKDGGNGTAATPYEFVVE